MKSIRVEHVVYIIYSVDFNISFEWLGDYRRGSDSSNVRSKKKPWQMEAAASSEVRCPCVHNCTDGAKL